MRFKVVNNTGSAKRVGGKVFPVGETELDMTMIRYIDRIRRHGLVVEEHTDAASNNQDKVNKSGSTASSSESKTVLKENDTAVDKSRNNSKDSEKAKSEKSKSAEETKTVSDKKEKPNKESSKSDTKKAAAPTK